VGRIKITHAQNEAELRRKIGRCFFFVLLQLTFPDKNETIESHISMMKKNLRILADLNPLFINSHTGRDHFSFDDNCKAIDTAMNFSAQHNIRILHETHRGRFSFHTTTLLPYLQKFPDMELVGDLSHFCTVSESMLEDQEEKLKMIFPHIAHIHARIGFEQSPQINDPSAPEWSNHVEQFIQWWNTVLLLNKKAGKTLFTITPEFGPVPYMPVLPFTQTPLSNQWDNNVYMLNLLNNKFGNEF
jgi:sugar phosphate isomerase/epimerase